MSARGSHKFSSETSTDPNRTRLGGNTTTTTNYMHYMADQTSAAETFSLTPQVGSVSYKYDANNRDTKRDFGREAVLLCDRQGSIVGDQSRHEFTNLCADFGALKQVPTDLD